MDAAQVRGQLHAAARPREHDVTTIRTALARVQQEISRLRAEPAIRALPTGRLTNEYDLWRSGYQPEREVARQAPIRSAGRVNIERGQRLGLSAYGPPVYGRDRQHQRPVGFDPIRRDAAVCGQALSNQSVDRQAQGRGQSRLVRVRGAFPVVAGHERRGAPRRDRAQSLLT